MIGVSVFAEGSQKISRKVKPALQDGYKDVLQSLIAKRR